MKCFIGVIASIAMFNLNEDEFESHFLKDGRRAFVIDATDEKISVWKEANKNNLIDCSLEEIRTNSETLDFTKKRILEFMISVLQALMTGSFRVCLILKRNSERTVS